MYPIYMFQIYFNPALGWLSAGVFIDIIGSSEEADIFLYGDDLFDKLECTKEAIVSCAVDICTTR